MLVTFGGNNKHLILLSLVAKLEAEGCEGALSSSKTAFESKDFNCKYCLTSGTKCLKNQSENNCCLIHPCLLLSIVVHR